MTNTLGDANPVTTSFGTTTVFKSDRGALSVKDEREMLLTTRSSSEKFTL